MGVKIEKIRPGGLTITKQTNRIVKKIFILAFLFLLAQHCSFAQQSQLADSLYHIETPVLIPSQSGIDISAIIVRKKTNDEPLPVVLFYTTYHQGEGDAIFAKLAAERDFVGVVAYARGVRTNMDEYSPYEHEQSDIYDIIDWLSKQEWSNGEVGMFGGSYTGFLYGKESQGRILSMSRGF